MILSLLIMPGPAEVIVAGQLQDSRESRTDNYRRPGSNENHNYGPATVEQSPPSDLIIQNPFQEEFMNADGH